jgi:hypothetical protein
MNKCSNPNPGAAHALNELWKDVLAQLRLQLTKNHFDAYIRDTSVLELAADTLFIATPDAAQAAWLNSRLASTVRRLVAPALSHPVEVCFVAQDAAALDRVLADTPAVPAAAEAEIAPAPEPNQRLTPAAAVEEQGSEPLLLFESADSIEAALQQPGRIVTIPRYELRFIPLVGAEFFFLRLAFLQERYLHTPADGRGRSFETSVHALLSWANVGKATLHRFKKGDLARGQAPAAAWFGIEQLPSPPRTAGSQQQPPCRYRIQQGIPLTPVDAACLRAQLLAAGIQANPLEALQTLCAAPLSELLPFPPPSAEELRGTAPGYTSVSSLVQALLSEQKVTRELAGQIADWSARLAEHITMPNQVVHLSWYFLRHWLPLLGHDAAALVLYAQSQGYYNPQTSELRDEIEINGGYAELARAIGLKRDRTIGDWLPNLFDSHPRGNAPAEEENLPRERPRTFQDLLGGFLALVPGSRRKTLAGHYAFRLRVALKGDPLTPADRGLRDWLQAVLPACERAGVRAHWLRWAQSGVMRRLADRLEPAQNDVAGTLGAQPGEQLPLEQNDVWGILALRSELAAAQPALKMPSGESLLPQDDGWGILEQVLHAVWGTLAPPELTFGELFKGLLRLNTYWKTSPTITNTTAQPAVSAPVPAGEQAVVVDPFDLRLICSRSGGMNSYRQRILEKENSTAPFLSWLLYAYSRNGRGIQDPVGWALSRLRESPGAAADGAFVRLANLPPERLEHLVRSQVESGAAPAHEDWGAVFRDVPVTRLRELSQVLGLAV